MFGKSKKLMADKKHKKEWQRLVYGRGYGIKRVAQ